MFKSSFDPASVEFQIERSIHNYPMLYANRTQVLHRQFMVLGTGVEWRGGALVDLAYEGDRSEDDVVLHGEDFLLDNGLMEALGDAAELFRETLEVQNDELLQRRRNASALALTPGSLDSVYPPSFSTPFFQVPADAKVEWLAAREEIYAVVEPLWYAGKHKQLDHTYLADTLPDPSASTVPARFRKDALHV